MNIDHIHCFGLTVGPDGTLQSDPSGFDPREYSSFKYGEFAVVRRYGSLLSERVREAYPEVVESEDEVVITSVPYFQVPTAANLLAETVASTLNWKRRAAGRARIRMSKIAKDRLGVDVYAGATAEGREKILASHEFHLDPSTFRGKTVLLIDDLRITGVTERNLFALLESAAPRRIIVAHVAAFASLENTTASIENSLNKTSLSYAAVDALIRSDNFRLNTRVLKFLLEDVGNLTRCMTGWPRRHLDAIRRGIEASRADLETRYPEAVAVVGR